MAIDKAEFWKMRFTGRIGGDCGKGEFYKGGVALRDKFVAGLFAMLLDISDIARSDIAH